MRNIEMTAAAATVVVSMREFWCREFLLAGRWKDDDGKDFARRC